MQYQYTKLRTADNDEDTYIRLVELLPGSTATTETISCRILEVLLSQAPAYEAVSYRWGPRADAGTIHILSLDARNAEIVHTLTLPATLIPFLRRSRWKTDVRLFWIDSICINQDSDEEKTLQVPRMRDIYMKAMRTLCWLGPEADGSASAIKYAEVLNKLLRRKAVEVGVGDLSEQETKDGVASFQFDVKLGDPALEAFFRLLRRPYFERAWIVQECIVSTNVWFVAGASVMSWYVFIGSVYYIICFQSWLLETYPSHSMTFMLALRYGEMEWQSKEDNEWWRVLLRHRLSSATDPRDKVYAYYGLQCKADFQKMGIEPDYLNASIEVLYTRLASRALGTLHQAEVFNVPKLIRSHHRPGDDDWTVLCLPSWVPDWRYTDDTPLSLIGAEANAEEQRVVCKDYNATNGSTLEVEFDTGEQDGNEAVSQLLPTLVQIRGYVIGQITQLSRRSWTIEVPVGSYTLLGQARVMQENQTQIAEWEPLLQSQDDPLIYTPTNESFEFAAVETLLAGRSTYTKEQKYAAWRSYESRQRLLRVLPRLGLHHFIAPFVVVVLVERVLRYLGFSNPAWRFRLMLGSMANRKFARAMSVDSAFEYLGLVSGLCELGDHVVLVKGVRLPLILRPKGEREIQAGKHKGRKVKTWEFLGDAYVHGIMKGEKWDQAKCEEFWLV